MRAVVYEGPRKISVANVPDAKIEEPTDVLVRITSTNICGSDLHMYEGRTSVEAELLRVVSHHCGLDDAPEAYEHFDARDNGWTKVILHPNG